MSLLKSIGSDVGAFEASVESRLSIFSETQVSLSTRISENYVSLSSRISENYVSLSSRISLFNPNTISGDVSISGGLSVGGSISALQEISALRANIGDLLVVHSDGLEISRGEGSGTIQEYVPSSGTIAFAQPSSGTQSVNAGYEQFTLDLLNDGGMTFQYVGLDSSNYPYWSVTVSGTIYKVCWKVDHVGTLSGLTYTGWHCFYSSDGGSTYSELTTYGMYDSPLLIIEGMYSTALGTGEFFPFDPNLTSYNASSGSSVDVWWNWAGGIIGHSGFTNPLSVDVPSGSPSYPHLQDSTSSYFPVNTDALSSNVQMWGAAHTAKIYSATSAFGVSDTVAQPPVYRGDLIDLKNDLDSLFDVELSEYESIFSGYENFAVFGNASGNYWSTNLAGGDLYATGGMGSDFVWVVKLDGANYVVSVLNADDSASSLYLTEVFSVSSNSATFLDSTGSASSGTIAVTDYLNLPTAHQTGTAQMDKAKMLWDNGPNEQKFNFKVGNNTADIKVKSVSVDDAQGVNVPLGNYDEFLSSFNNAIS